MRKENLLHAWNLFPNSPRQLIQHLFTLYLTISVQYQFWDTYCVERQLETVQLETGKFMKHQNGTGEAFKNQLMNSLWCHSNLENPWQITVAIMLPYICTDPLFSKVSFWFWCHWISTSTLWCKERQPFCLLMMDKEKAWSRPPS